MIDSGCYGAGEGIRTLDIHLGKVVLYQLSYARIIYLIKSEEGGIRQSEIEKFIITG